MILDVTCAFLYGFMRRRVCIELPDQGPKSKDTMHGTRGTPQIWYGEVKREMIKLGFVASVLRPSVFTKTSCDVFAAVYVDGFLCVGVWHESESLCVSLKKVYDLKNTMVGRGYRRSST